MRCYFRLTCEEGAVFITTMICTLLMLLVGGSLYQLTAHEFIYINRLNNNARAHSLAEAGLSKALATLKNDFDSKDNAANFPLTSLGGGTYDAAVATISSRVLVSSVGVYRNAQRIVTAEVAAPTLSALDYGLAAGGNVVWDPGTSGSSGTVNGDIYAVGNVNVDGTVNGDIDTGGGNITGTNSGSQNTNAGVAAFPVVNMSYYQAIAQANDQYYASDQTYANGTFLSSPAGGVVYVNGNITLNGDHTTTACIVATGNITIQKTGSNNPDVTINQYSNYPAMVALGNIVITCSGNSGGGGSFTATGLIYTQGNFDVSGNHFDNPEINITGSIIANGNITTSLTSNNTVNLTYQEQNPPGFTLPSSTMTILSYNN